VASVEADVSRHISDHADFVTSLSAIHDKEPGIRHEFSEMTESTSAADLTQIPRAQAELDVPPGLDLKDAYRPCSESSVSSDRGCRSVASFGRNNQVIIGMTEDQFSNKAAQNHPRVSVS
jgi:hypothetical protein